MKIVLEPNVIQHLKDKKSSVITLSVNQSGGGCCPTIETAEVDLSAPKNVEDYILYEQDGYQVYVGRNVKVGTPVLKFVLEKVLFFKSIEAKGLILKTHD